MALGTKVCTLLIDVFKGFIVFILHRVDLIILAMLAFAAVVIGHIYPVVFKFKGGKGVATLGAAMALNWPSMFAAALIAVVVAAD